NARREDRKIGDGGAAPDDQRAAKAQHAREQGFSDRQPVHDDIGRRVPIVTNRLDPREPHEGAKSALLPAPCPPSLPARAIPIFWKGGEPRAPLRLRPSDSRALPSRPRGAATRAAISSGSGPSGDRSPWSCCSR